MPRRLFALGLRYPWLVALGVTTTGIAIRAMLNPLFQDIPPPFITGWASTIIVTLLCGLEYGLMSMMVFTFVGWWFYLEHAIHAGALSNTFIFMLLCTTNVLIVRFLVKTSEQSLRDRQHELETAVAERTKDKDQLIREINHRVGNNLQVMLSMFNIAIRKKEICADCKAMDGFVAEVEKMGDEHRAKAQWDYLK